MPNMTVIVLGVGVLLGIILMVFAIINIKKLPLLFCAILFLMGILILVSGILMIVGMSAN